ncbi:hypothetical protein Asp14428_31530 [Actinoplanes sp. NBRC 14428]|nr:hypothetical protein Asp14428_31530 [Actinoplanes sp. NBRC 14428]
MPDPPFLSPQATAETVGGPAGFSPTRLAVRPGPGPADGLAGFFDLAGSLAGCLRPGRQPGWVLEAWPAAWLGA